MKLFLTTFVLLVIALQSYAARIGTPAARLPQESYETARNRHLFSATFNIPGVSRTQWGPGRIITPERAKRPLANLDLNQIPDFGSYSDLETQFKFLRDTRFIESEDPDFPRRPTWLYPDDGCYARAEIIKTQLENRHLPSPKKIFVFGNLIASTKNTPSGTVQWWYHVAITYRIGSEAYVMDPALEPSRPLMLSEWNKRVGGEKTKLQYAICSADTFDPVTDCNGSEAVSAEAALSEQKSFFEDEWVRLLELNRKPEQELGDQPPWL